jgi:Flp pilus assembly protein TadG
VIGLKSESKRIRRRGESGQALIMFVLGLAVFLGMVALTIDVGLILHERRQLQNTADAAALAGVIELPQSTVLAQSKAQEWAANNGIDLAEGDEIQITIADDDTSVTVEVTRETSFVFGRVLGLTTVDVSASAVAQVGAPASLAGIMPFAVLEDAIDYSVSPTTIKYDANDPTTGNFAPLKIDGPGSSTYEDTIINGSTNSACGLSQPTCADPTEVTQTGNLVGGTRDGIEYRFNNTSQECDEFNEVLIPDGNGSYRVDGACNPWTEGSNSLRLVLIPVVESFCNGSCTVTILYFTGFFLDDLANNQCTGNSCEIEGTFVKTVFDPTNDAVLGIFDPDSGVKFVRLVE